MVEQFVCFDVESTGVNPWKGDRPFALSFCWPDGTTEYFHWRVNPYNRKVERPNRPQLKHISSVLCDPALPKVGHNTMFDVRICDPLEKGLGLKPLANKFFQIPHDDEKNLQKAVVSGRLEGKKLGWALHEEVKADYWIPAALARTEAEESACREYCTLDTLRTLMLFRMYSQVAKKNERFARTYAEEMERWPVTKRMVSHGIRTDLYLVKKECAWCEAKMKDLRARLEAIFGPFNKEIPDGRMRKYLFSPRKEGGLGFTPDPRKVTKKQKLPQVSREVLESFGDRVPIIAAKIELDKISRAYGTYFQTYLRKAVPENGYYVLHAGFDQIGAKTGRFSCREPNLQNVPKRAEEGDIMQRVRGPFGPRPDCIWLHLDYQGIEARIFAEEANEPDMIRIFGSGGDVYQELVDRIVAMTGLNLKQLLRFADSAGKPGSGARQICKNNFLGWLYGEGKEKLMRAMRLPSLVIAEQVINSLRMAYPKAMPFMQRMQHTAKRNKYVVNRYERVVPIEPPMFKDGEWIEFWYKATNYLIQSTAADMMKRAMPKCQALLDDWTNTFQVLVRMVMTIHDELVFEFPLSFYSINRAQELAAVMQGAAEEHMYRVRFPVDGSITTTQWSTPEKINLNEKGGVTCLLPSRQNHVKPISSRVAALLR